MAELSSLIINYTPTGMVPTKLQSPHVPISVSEIVEDVLQANALGITLVHLHARDDMGVPTYKQEIYRSIVEGIKKYAPNLVICISLSGRNFSEFEKRAEPLELMPDMGSLTLSSLNFASGPSINSPDMIRMLAEKMEEKGVIPELEVFDIGMVNFGKYLIQKNILKPPYYFNIITGNVAGIQVDFSHIAAMISSLPPESYWALGGIGDQQLKANTLAIASGGGVRVGLEDNLFFDQQKSVKATNFDLLNRIHTIANIFERPIMTSSEFRKLGFTNKLLK